MPLPARTSGYARLPFVPTSRVKKNHMCFLTDPYGLTQQHAPVSSAPLKIAQGDERKGLRTILTNRQTRIHIDGSR